MKILILNGSPRKKGTVATLLKAVVEGINENIKGIGVASLQAVEKVRCTLTALKNDFFSHLGVQNMLKIHAKILPLNIFPKYFFLT